MARISSSKCFWFFQEFTEVGVVVAFIGRLSLSTTGLVV
jgi:hypothetical protein